MKRIDYETVRGGLLELVEEFGPDYIYDVQYSHGDTPGCIVGHFLHRQGLSLAELRALDKLKYSAFRALLQFGRLPFDFTEDAVRFLSNVQTYQDTGAPWSLAVNTAIAEVEETE